MFNNESKSILVTGASSGIGHAIALHLARNGFTVLATLRKQTDVDLLNGYNLSGLHPVCPLDLTNSEQTRAIATQIRWMINDGKVPPLYAIINVAGGGQVAPVELMDTDAYRQELEKRLVGPVILLQELLPLLRVTCGRIVWIATPGLLPVPYVTDIHAPDFAVNYLARTLNIELQPDGIHNILIRCGGIATSSPEKSERQLALMLRTWPEDRTKIYLDRLLKLQKGFGNFNVKRTDPETVALTVGKALTAKHPRTQYQVGYMSGFGAFVEKLPQSWVDFILRKMY
jgi:Dehydrogenases with different specificities (related to short-chain alcohol dehydrogenases)